MRTSYIRRGIDRSISGDGSVNEHRAVDVGGAELDYRADQHPRELTVSTTAHNQEVGSLGSFDKEGAGWPCITWAVTSTDE
jgi:chitodextrinase